MFLHKHHGPFLLVVLLGLTLSLAACDDTAIDPFDNDERYYTIYGYLDVLETNHKVRVIPITRRAERIESPIDAQAEIDAVVTSTDLRTGETRSWSHSLEKLEDGTYSHVFQTNFIVWPGHTYRLEVKRSDGVTTTAETTVPGIPEATYFELGDVKVSPDSSEVRQEVFIPNVPSLWGVESVYLLGNQTRNQGALHNRFLVPLGRPGVRTADGSWRLTVNISQDQAHVRDEYEAYRDAGVYDSTAVVMTAMGVQIRMLDANWDPPEGIFDPEVLAQPGRLSNVENGYGFWGSIGLYRQEWPVSFEFSKLLGWWF